MTKLRRWLTWMNVELMVNATVFIIIPHSWKLEMFFFHDTMTFWNLHVLQWQNIDITSFTFCLFAVVGDYWLVYDQSRFFHINVLIRQWFSRFSCRQFSLHHSLFANDEFSYVAKSDERVCLNCAVISSMDLFFVSGTLNHTYKMNRTCKTMKIINTQGPITSWNTKKKKLRKCV